MADKETQIELEKIAAESSKKEGLRYRLSFMREVYEAHGSGQVSYRDTLILSHGGIYLGNNFEEFYEITEENKEDIALFLPTMNSKPYKSHIMAILYPHIFGD